MVSPAVQSGYAIAKSVHFDAGSYIGTKIAASISAGGILAGTHLRASECSAFFESTLAYENRCNHHKMGSCFSNISGVMSEHFKERTVVRPFQQP